MQEIDDLKSTARCSLAALLLALYATSAVSHASTPPDKIRQAVDNAIQPVMEKYGVPGMAVGIVVGGTSYVFNYGVASTQTGNAVSRDTLFELGSVSKTFTATLAAYAQANGQLSLSDKTSRHLPALRGSEFGNLTLLNLGTHTPGGLPLQVPDAIRNDDQLMQYLKAWRPTYVPGTYRTYANPGIGTLGLITAKSMGQPFDALMEQRLFPALGMKNTYLHVPDARMADYAQGYTKDNAPIRMAAAELSSEAYGIKTTAADMVRFVEANLGTNKLNGKLRQAIATTHTGYYKAGAMTQDLIWEQYPYPVALKTLLEGNSAAMIFDATPVTQIMPPQPPRDEVWINKTGSTNGFGAYVAFVPQKRLGIVLLANKNFPIDERVAVAYTILASLAHDVPTKALP